MSNCATRRPRPAPSAARTASSLRRVAPLASSRLATLAHAISSTSATAPKATETERCKPAPTSSRAKRLHGDGPFAIVDRRIFGQGGVDGLHSFAGLGQRGAAAQTSVDGEPVNLERSLVGREDQRLPEPGVVAIESAGREHADHLVGFAVQHRPAAQNVGIAAEVVLPGGVAEDDHGSRSRPVFFRREGAAKLDVCGEYPEVIGRHRLAGQAVSARR